MSEEYQWRQLGSILNTVLAQTRTQAVRNGFISTKEAEPSPAKVARLVRAVQLELPFGIAPIEEDRPSAEFGRPQAPRSLRLM